MKKVIFSLFIGSIIFAGCKSETDQKLDLNISLAQWSLHKSFFGDALNGDWAAFGKLLKQNPDSLLQGKLNPDDFPKIAAGYGVNTIELVNTFYFSKAKDMAYWEGFKKKCDATGVSVGLIMCDALGDLGNADSLERQKAVENHYDWVKIAKYLGAATIRVNAAGTGKAEEVAKNAVEGLTKLGEYAAKEGINVVVENHGGFSSDGS
jgi:sugar phosphate isomerase/epimerase